MAEPDLDGAARPVVPFGDVILPVFLPLGVTLLQTLLWDLIAPFVWLSYLPSVALAAWFCGLNGGLLALTLSLGLAEWLLLGPAVPHALPLAESRAVAALLFALLGLAVVFFLQRFRQESEAMRRALAPLRKGLLLSPVDREADPSDLTLVLQLARELAIRDAALAANPFPLALFAADGRCLYASADFADQLLMPLVAVYRLQLIADASFPIPGVAVAAAQLLEGRGGEQLSVSDGVRRCQLRLLPDAGQASLLLSLHEDTALGYGGSEDLHWAAREQANLQEAERAAIGTPTEEGGIRTGGAPGGQADGAAGGAVLHPAATAPEATAAGAGAGHRAGALAGLRCLVVDDHPINRQLLQEILMLDGAVVTLAKSGRDAIALVREAPSDFDVVLMDLQMPGIDGYQAVRQIRSFLGASALPIYAITADGAGVDRSRLQACGFQGLLHKPVELPMLLQALSALPVRRPLP